MIAHWAVLTAAALTILVAAPGQRRSRTRRRRPHLRPGFAAFLLPLAALLVITAIALAHEVRSGRGRGVAVTMPT